MQGHLGAFLVDVDPALRVDLPENSRIEYKFEVVRGEHGEWITDPFNPVKAADPFGANSVAQTLAWNMPFSTMLTRPTSRPHMHMSVSWIPSSSR